MGGRRDQEDNHGEDANPMNKALPNEVVRRKPKETQKAVAESALVTTDRKVVLAMKPDQRSKWLAKGLQQAQEGRMQAASMFDIIAHQKFTADLKENEKIGKRMYRQLKGGLQLFSSKQQRHLASGCALAKEFGEEDEAEATAAGDSAGPPVVDTAMEEMMARCRSFVREKQAERGERKPGEEKNEKDAAPSADGNQDEGMTPPVGSNGGETATADAANQGVKPSLDTSGAAPVSEDSTGANDSCSAGTSQAPPGGGAASRSRSRSRRSKSSGSEKSMQKQKGKEKEKEKSKERGRDKEIEKSKGEVSDKKDKERDRKKKRSEESSESRRDRRDRGKASKKKRTASSHSSKSSASESSHRDRKSKKKKPSRSRSRSRRR
ncbi:unnamed protein product [Polarella glacialis]|uniref:Uncharacterized protein n=1 Tax=Polarella glacialis TaxID=89957 RepID=A0A813I877_POLGL|nr:unnamed protein product [Polarella glacialis]